MSNQPDTKTGGSGSGSAAGAATAAAKTGTKAERLAAAREHLGKGWNFLTLRRSPERVLEFPEPTADGKSDYIDQDTASSADVRIEVNRTVAGRNVTLTAKPPVPANLTAFEMAVSVAFDRTTTTAKTTEAAVVWLARARLTHQAFKAAKLVADKIKPTFEAKHVIVHVGTHVIMEIVLGGAAKVVEHTHVSDATNTLTVSLPNGGSTSTVGWSWTKSNTVLHTVTQAGAPITKTGGLDAWYGTITFDNAHPFLADTMPIHELMPAGPLRDAVKVLYEKLAAAWLAKRALADKIVTRYNTLLKSFTKHTGTNIDFYDFEEAPAATAAATAAATSAAAATATATAATGSAGAGADPEDRFLAQHLAVPTRYMRFVIGMNVTGLFGDALYMITSDDGAGADKPTVLLKGKSDLKRGQYTDALAAHVAKNNLLGCSLP